MANETPFNRNPISNKEQFKQYCLRKLGDGILTINVTDEQVEDCINDSVKWAQEFLDEGNFIEYFAHKITQEDLNNKYFTLTNEVLQVQDIIFETSYVGSTLNNIFQLSTIALVNNLRTPSSGLSDWYMLKFNLAQLNAIMKATHPFRYNYNSSKLYIDIDWNMYMKKDHYFIIKAWIATDPNNNISLWNNNFLKKYCTALIQKQWGNNLSKYNDIALPGGTKLNGKQILDEAKEELDNLNKEIINYQSNPCGFWCSVLG